MASLIQSLSGGAAPALAPADFQAAAVFNDTSAATWGLQATRVLQSSFSGRGIRVAVLDTGLDLNHPDFQGRAINSQSFIVGEAVQDGNGHGTQPREGRKNRTAHTRGIFEAETQSSRTGRADRTDPW